MSPVLRTFFFGVPKSSPRHPDCDTLTNRTKRTELGIERKHRLNLFLAFYANLNIALKAPVAVQSLQFSHIAGLNPIEI